MLSPARKLGVFVRFLARGHSLPCRKALADWMFAVALSGGLCLSDWATVLSAGEPGTFGSILARLSDGMSRESFSDSTVSDQILHRSLRHLREGGGQGMTVAFDLTSTEHRHAKIDPRFRDKYPDRPWPTRNRHGAVAHPQPMWGVTQVWQGSQGRVDRGTRWVVAEARTASGRKIPLALSPINQMHDSGFKSERHSYLDVFRNFAWTLPVAATVEMDRGFGKRKDFLAFDHFGYPWTARLTISELRKKKKTGDPGLKKGVNDDQKLGGGLLLRGEDGRARKAREHAFNAPIVAEFEEQRARDQRRGRGASSVAIRAAIVGVTVKGKRHLVEGPPRTLVAAHTAGKGARVLLHSRALTDPEDIIRVHQGYHQRWHVETLAKLAKEGKWGTDWESARLLTGTSIPRGALLVRAYALFLDELQHSGPKVREPLIQQVNTTADDPDDWRFRLAKAMRIDLRRRVEEAQRRQCRTGEPWPRGHRAWMGILYPEGEMP